MNIFSYIVTYIYTFLEYVYCKLNEYIKLKDTNKVFTQNY